MKRITAEDIINALVDVKTGADIWGYADAKLYRDLGKLGLVDIVPAQNAPEDGAKRQPYFGCIINARGSAMIREFKRRTKNPSGIIQNLETKGRLP